MKVEGRELYDFLADDYFRYRFRTFSQVRNFLEIVIGEGHLAPGDKILDIGCGVGNYSVPLAEEYSFQVTGIDPSEEMLRFASTRSGRVNWVKGKMESLPFSDESFHAAIGVMILHHVSPERRSRGFRETFRVLKKSGTFFVLTSLPERFHLSLLSHFPGVMDIDKRRFPSRREIHSLFMDNGFSSPRLIDVPRIPSVYSKEEYLRLVEGKFVSTFHIMSEEKYQEGLRKFKRWLESVKGERIRDRSLLALFVGRKD